MVVVDMAYFICFQIGRLNSQAPDLKNAAGEMRMGLTRIFVLGATFFLVALCPHIDSALVAFGFGLGAYTGLWLFEIIRGRDKS